MAPHIFIKKNHFFLDFGNTIIILVILGAEKLDIQTGKMFQYRVQNQRH
jgi:hypothetical protein